MDLAKILERNGFFGSAEVESVWLVAIGAGLSSRMGMSIGEFHRACRYDWRRISS